MIFSIHKLGKPNYCASKWLLVEAEKMRTRARERNRQGRTSTEDSTGKTRVVALGELSTGATGTICRLACRRQLRRRLMDMGVVAGTPVKIERVAPLGDPIELKLKGFHLSLRREEAGDIWVEVPEDEC